MEARRCHLRAPGHRILQAVVDVDRSHQALNSAPARVTAECASVNINNGLQDAMTGRTQMGIFSASIGRHMCAACAACDRDRLDTPSGGGRPTSRLRPRRCSFDFPAGSWVMARTGTPADVIKKLNAAIRTRQRATRRCGACAEARVRAQSEGRGHARTTRAPFWRRSLPLWAKTTQNSASEPQ